MTNFSWLYLFLSANTLKLKLTKSHNLTENIPRNQNKCFSILIGQKALELYILKITTFCFLFFVFVFCYSPQANFWKQEQGEGGSSHRIITWITDGQFWEVVNLVQF